MEIDLVMLEIGTGKEVYGFAKICKSWAPRWLSWLSVQLDVSSGLEFKPVSCIGSKDVGVAWLRDHVSPGPGHGPQQSPRNLAVRSH